MPQFINTNVASLTAQRNLNTSQSALNTSLERLSSGLRINSAKDDAAGLAITERFTTQIRGLNQASRNANDAISLSQTAEGALGEIGNNLQRIRELAVQSANATNSSSDRAALDLEVQQRLAEIDRISSQTSFNGQKVLDGSFGTAAFQVGANVGETISLDLSSSTRTDSMGSAASATTGDVTATFSNTVIGSAVTTALSSGDLTINTQDVGAVSTADAADQAAAISAIDGVTATATNSVTITFTDIAADGDSGDGYTLSLDGNTTDIIDTTGTNTATNAEAARAAIDAVDGYTATISGQDITITKADGGNIALSETQTDTSGSATGASGFKMTLSSGAASNTDTTIGKFSITSDSDAAVVIGGTNTASIAKAGLAEGTFGSLVLEAGDFTVQVGTDTAVAIEGTFESAADLISEINTNVTGVTATLDSDTGKITLNSASKITFTGADATGAVAADGATSGLGFAGLANSSDGDLRTVDVNTVAGANDAIFRMDSSLTSISTLRSTFGAIQNRFESTISNLATTSENLSAARSRIQDADFASETAALTRAQILQQAGVSILSQANSLPQNVLALLQ